MRTRARFVMSGLVQGVCYRMCAAAEARRHSLVGWVANLADGRVEVVVEGDAKDVDVLLGWCRRGPPAARVEDVETDYSPPTNEFDRFAIRHIPGR